MIGPVCMIAGGMGGDQRALRDRRGERRGGAGSVEARVTTSPTDVQPAHKQPAHEQPAHEQPAHEQPAHEQPSHERPTVLVTLTGSDRPGVTAAVFGRSHARRRGARPRAGRRPRAPVPRGARDAPATTRAAVAAAHAIRRHPRPAGELRRRLVATTRSRRSGRLHVTMIGAPLLPGAVAAIAGRLAQRGANIDRIRRLSRDPVTTVEFDVSGDDVRDPAARACRRGRGAHRVDVAVSPAGLARRGRRLVVMDVDSTLIQDEVIELLAARAGRAGEVAAVTERAMRGELDFAASLHERVACLAGLPASVLDDVRGAVRLTPGARTLCRTLRRLGFTLALVSGGFAEVVEPLAADLDIQHVRANRLEVRRPPAHRPRPRCRRRPGRQGRRAAGLRRGGGAAARPHGRHRRRRQRPRHARRGRARHRLQRQARRARARQTRRSTCPTSTPCSTCWASPAPRSRRPTRSTCCLRVERPGSSPGPARDGSPGR